MNNAVWQFVNIVPLSLPMVLHLSLGLLLKQLQTLTLNGMLHRSQHTRVQNTTCNSTWIFLPGQLNLDWGVKDEQRGDSWGSCEAHCCPCRHFFLLGSVSWPQDWHQQLRLLLLLQTYCVTYLEANRAVVTSKKNLQDSWTLRDSKSLTAQAPQLAPQFHRCPHLDDHPSSEVVDVTMVRSC